MTKTTRIVAKLSALAGMLAIAALGSAAWLDTDIIIKKALNSPSFTVKYTGLAVAMIDVRVNGSSIGTRYVSGSKTSGEADFTLDVTSLDDGENDVEVRLLDKNGKLLGTQNAVISTGDQMPSPVRMTAPKMGSTIQGPIEIKVGFGKELKNVYVSYFVDEQFKAMTNVAPYSWFWDTTNETNGWHELQAWLVDDNSYTFKTRKVRVFVNNPGGRTNRVDVTPNALTTATNTVKPLTTAASGVKAANAGAAAVKNAATTTVPTLNLQPALNGVSALTTSAAGLKSAQGVTSTTGAKLVTPKTGATPLPTKINGVTGPTVTNTMAAAGTISITKGQRLPNLGAFTIVMNSKVVNFDVQPRVQDGVPLTPFRHLIEEAGGKVDWAHLSKQLSAEADGKTILVKIGDRIAKINELPVELELAPFIERGRTIVPLSFIRDTLQVDVEFDVKTGHVLITSVKKTK